MPEPKEFELATLEEKLSGSKLLYSPEGIKYLLLEGFPKATYDLNTAKIIEQVVVRGADLVNFIEGSFGEWVETTSGITRTPTRSHISNSRMGVSRINYEPFLNGFPGDPWNAYPKDENKPFSYCPYFRVTIEYSPKRNEEGTSNDPEKILEVHADASAEFLNTLLYEPADEPSLAKGISDRNANPVIKLVPTTQWTVSWRFVSDYFFRTRLLPEIRRAIGKVNRYNMSEVIFGLAPETCLFVGYSLEQAYTWREVQLIDTPTNEDNASKPYLNVHLKFVEKNVGPVSTDEGFGLDWEIGGHNHAWKTKVGWIRLYRNRPTLDLAGNPDPNWEGEPLYELTDLNFLFSPRLNVPGQGEVDPGEDGNEAGDANQAAGVN